LRWACQLKRRKTFVERQSLRNAALGVALVDHSHRFRGRSAFIQKTVHTYGRLLKQLTRPVSRFEFSLSRSFERDSNPKNLRCELSLWPLTFLNYTKMTKYEALEKNAVSEPEMPQSGDLHYSRNSRKPHFIGRFSAYSLMENWVAGMSGGGRGTGVEPSPRRPA